LEQPLPAERHRTILEVVRERHAVRVSTLSELLGVSEVTVRRDLEDLEHRGLLERTHGGAISTQRLGVEQPYLEAFERNAPEKLAIGRAAAELVQPGDTIFLNGGTTTFQVFRHLQVAGVRVITNHVGIASEAADRDLELIVVGGEYRAPSNSCVGSFATQMLRGTFASRSLIGVEGLSIRSGLTTPAAPEAEIARVMIEQTHGPVIVVADSTKVGTIADFWIAPLEVSTTLVTDAGVDGFYLDELASVGVEVVITGRGAPVHVGVGRGEG
jgi:DeoR/GlpR family transcriptional regulator of sugar metabolism